MLCRESVSCFMHRSYYTLKHLHLRMIINIMHNTFADWQAICNEPMSYMKCCTCNMYICTGVCMHVNQILRVKCMLRVYYMCNICIGCLSNGYHKIDRVQLNSLIIATQDGCINMCQFKVKCMGNACDTTTRIPCKINFLTYLN